MAQGFTVTIVQKPLKRAAQKRVPALAAQEVQKTNPVSFKVAFKQSGYHVLQNLSSLNDQRQLALVNGVVPINSDVSFMVLVTNVGKTDS